MAAVRCRLSIQSGAVPVSRRLAAGLKRGRAAVVASGGRGDPGAGRGGGGETEEASSGSLHSTVFCNFLFMHRLG